MIADKQIIKEINKAMKREIDAQKLYTSLYNKAKSQNSKVLFETLTIEEQKHEVLLKTFLDTGDIEIARKKITIFKTDFDITKKIIDSTLDSLELRNGMELAIKEEQKSSKIYFDIWNKLNKKEADLSFRNAILSLGKEEKRHESLIIREYRKLFGTLDPKFLK